MDLTVIFGRDLCGRSRVTTLFKRLAAPGIFPKLEMRSSAVCGLDSTRCHHLLSRSLGVVLFEACALIA